MPRGRIIKPEFWSDQKMARLTLGARLTYIASWNFSDDFGVVSADPGFLRRHIYSYENLDEVTFIGWLQEIEAIKRFLPFLAAGDRYYYLPMFLRHQRVDHPSVKNRNPVPPETILLEAKRLQDPRETLANEDDSREQYNLIQVKLIQSEGVSRHPRETPAVRLCFDTILNSEFNQAIRGPDPYRWCSDLLDKFGQAKIETVLPKMKAWYKKSGVMIPREPLAQRGKIWEWCDRELDYQPKADAFEAAIRDEE